MPGRAYKTCGRPGCGRLTLSAYCEYHIAHQRQQYDRQRADDPLRKLYHTAAWIAARLQCLARDVLCRVCRQAESTIADHKIPAAIWVAQHGGDVRSFYDQANLQGLCLACHNAKTAAERSVETH